MLLFGSASSALLIPTLAKAGFFSLSNLIGSSAARTEAASGSYNSQTLPLPTPAVNINPSGPSRGLLALADGSALLPEAGPGGTEVDIEEHPTSSKISVYTVHKGDTLSNIAEMFDVSVNTIIWANDLRGGVIREGDVLIILPITGVKHTIKKGETLASLAKTYKSDAHEIAQFNDLSETSPLTVGLEIIIPRGEVAAVAPSPKKASSMLQLAKQGKQTAPLIGVGGPDLGSYFIWPLQGGVITQGPHGFNGVDIGARTGTSIFASAAGTVLIARASGWNGGLGSYVVIEHDNGVQTLYAHMSKVLVSAGETVGQGGTIGKVGSTGQSTGPHLHFEVRGAKNPFSSYSLGQGQ